MTIEKEKLEANCETTNAAYKDAYEAVYAACALNAATDATDADYEANVYAAFKAAWALEPAMYAALAANGALEDYNKKNNN